MLDTSLVSTEKTMVLTVGRKQVEGAHAHGHLEAAVDQNVPSTDPRWGPRSVLFGVKNVVLKAWSKLYQVKQDRTESPTAFIK